MEAAEGLLEWISAASSADEPSIFPAVCFHPGLVPVCPGPGLSARGIQ